MEQTNRQGQNIIYDENNKIKLTTDVDNLSRKSVTHFENLANEIIYEVFEFLDFCHIYEAFSDLNRRFQNFLTDSSFLININLSFISKTTFQRYYTDIIIPYQHRIKSLQLSNPFIVKHVFSSVDTQSVFTRLKKLSLTDTDPEYLEELLIHLVSFSCLVSLVIKCIDGGQVTNNFYREIFCLPMLKYCNLSYKQRMSHDPLSIAINQLSPIEYLVINHPVHLDEINALLSYTPQLRHLSLQNLNSYPNGWINLYPIVLNHLTHVSLKINIIFDAFESMVKILFNQVQVLYIWTNNDESYSNASRWEELILSHMPYLRIFDIIVRFNLSINGDIAKYTNMINQFDSWFWVERQWFFQHHIRNLGIQYSISLSSTNPYRKKSFKFSKGKDENSQNLNINSVRFVDIYNVAAMINFRHYFPNATELKISGGFVNRDRTLPFFSLNSIIPLRKLTKLVITSFHINFSKIIELIQCTPNIHTFMIDTLDTNLADLILLQRSRNFQLVSGINNIKEMTIKSKNISKMASFFINLCPHMQHLTINILQDDHEDLWFLLPKYNNSNSHLTSLCIENITERQLTILQTFIEAEDINFIKINKLISNNIYLWW